MAQTPTVKEINLNQSLTALVNVLTTHEIQLRNELKQQAEIAPAMVAKDLAALSACITKNTLTIQRAVSTFLAKPSVVRWTEGEEVITPSLSSQLSEVRTVADLTKVLRRLKVEEVGDPKEEKDLLINLN